jgi:hypothetical protein
MRARTVLSARVRTDLLLDAEGVDVAEGDVPGVEPVRVLGPGREQEGGCEEEDERCRATRGPPLPNLLATRTHTVLYSRRSEARE